MTKFECPKCQMYLELRINAAEKYEFYCPMCHYILSGELFNDDDFQEMERIAEEIDNSKTTIYVKLSGFDQIQQLLKLLPELEESSISEIKKILMDNGMRWPLGNIYITEMNIFKARADLLGLEVLTG
jgi:formamidopyrimidine-DNA glycosylase